MCIKKEKQYVHKSISKKEVDNLSTINLFWVTSGIRTHDIQNHNLTL